MLPKEFTERMKNLLGAEYDSFAEALNADGVRAFRVNENKISTENFLKINPFGGSKIPFTDNGFYFNFDSIGNHPYHHAGMIYIQEPAAMSAVSSLDIKPDWTVLDLCAAPGGKSGQVAQKLTDGLLISNEIIPSRCKILTGNTERLGFKNVITTCSDAKKLSSLFGEEFDLIIADAPCSGEGMFRKDPDAINEWSQSNVDSCASRQAELLNTICRNVKHGGYLLYSTCTFSLEENEMTVDSFLNNHEDFKLVPVKKEVADCTADGIRFDGCQTESIELCRRFYPHISPGEGQFIALMQRCDGENFSVKRETALEDISASERKIVFDFLGEVLTEYDKDSVKKYKNSIVYFDRDFAVPKGIVFSCGVTVGNVEKNYVKPHHQLFMAMGKEFKRQINLTHDESEMYIKGLTFECDSDNGWAAALTEGCTLGGIKAVNRTAKNHYPKGLRKADR